MTARHRDVGARVIRTEIAGLEALAESLGAEFETAVARIAALQGRLICTGVGKSGHVARKIAATLASTGTPALYIHPTEASHGDMGMIGPEDGVLALSKSGEVAELSDILAYTRRFGIPLLGMTANRDSSLGKAADVVLVLPEAEEACAETRAPTTSTTMQIALGDALAVALLEMHGFTATDFRVFHPGGKLGAMLRTVGDLMHSGADMPLVRPDMAMADALLVMTEKRQGCAGVIDEMGRLVGIITDGDVRRRAGSGLAGLTAADVMTRSPRVTATDTLAAEVLAQLNAAGQSVIFAVDPDGRPRGVLHVHDILRAGVA